MSTYYTEPDDGNYGSPPPVDPSSDNGGQQQPTYRVTRPPVAPVGPPAYPPPTVANLQRHAVAESLKRGIDPALTLGVLGIESGFNPKAQGPVRHGERAQGPGQVMPSCVTTDTLCLTSTGWRRYDEIYVGEEILTYNTDSQRLEWQKVEAVYHHPDPGPLLRIYNQGFDFISTPDHKWVIEQRFGAWGKRRVAYDFREAQDLASGRKEDYIVRIGQYDFADDQVLPDEIVRLAGLVFARLSVSFIRQLTRAQANILWQSLLATDAWTYAQSGREGYNQSNLDRARDIQTLLFLLGRLSNLHGYDRDPSQHGPIRNGQRPPQTLATRYQSLVKTRQVTCSWPKRIRYEEVDSAPVWCPTVKNGTWIAWRNGYISVTGNTAATEAPKYGQDPKKVLSDPYESVLFTVNYLGDHLDSFGNVDDALRAYNAGPHRIQESHKFSETNAYVRDVNAAREVYAKALAPRLSEFASPVALRVSRPPVFSDKLPSEETGLQVQSESASPSSAGSSMGSPNGKPSTNQLLSPLDTVDTRDWMAPEAKAATMGTPPLEMTEAREPSPEQWTPPVPALLRPTPPRFPRQRTPIAASVPLAREQGPRPDELLAQQFESEKARGDIGGAFNTAQELRTKYGYTVRGDRDEQGTVWPSITAPATPPKWYPYQSPRAEQIRPDELRRQIAKTPTATRIAQDAAARAQEVQARQHAQAAAETQQAPKTEPVWPEELKSLRDKFEAAKTSGNIEAANEAGLELQKRGAVFMPGQSKLGDEGYEAGWPSVKPPGADRPPVSQGTAAFVEQERQRSQDEARIAQLQKEGAQYLQSLPAGDRKAALKARAEQLGYPISDEERRIAGVTAFEKGLINVGAPIMGAAGRVMSGIGKAAEDIAPYIVTPGAGPVYPHGYHSELRDAGEKLIKETAAAENLAGGGPVTRFARGVIGTAPLLALPEGLAPLAVETYLEALGGGASHGEALAHSATTIASLAVGGKLARRFETPVIERGVERLTAKGLKGAELQKAVNRDVQTVVGRWIARSGGLGAGFEAGSIVAGEPQTPEAIGGRAGMAGIFGLHGRGAELPGGRQVGEVNLADVPGERAVIGLRDQESTEAGLYAVRVIKPGEEVPSLKQLKAQGLAKTEINGFGTIIHPNGLKYGDVRRAVRNNQISFTDRAEEHPLPETPETLDSQMAALRAGRKQAVLITPGETLPANADVLEQEGLVTTPTAAGTFIHRVDVSSEDIQESVEAGDYGKYLGYVAPRAEGPEAQTVVARHPETGHELQSAVVPPEAAASQAQAFQDQFPGATVGVEHPGKVIQERTAARSEDTSAVLERARGRLASGQAVDDYIAQFGPGVKGTRGYDLQLSNAREVLAPEVRTPEGLAEHGEALTPIAQQVVDEAYYRALEDPKISDVVMGLGGSGAGKSVAHEAETARRTSIYLETHGEDVDALTSMIDEALARGKKVTVNGISRDPGDAYESVIDRFKQGDQRGKVVPLDRAAESHTLASDAFNELKRRFEGEAGVEFNAIDNSGQVPKVSSEMPAVSTEEARAKMQPVLDRAAEEGRLTEDERQRFLGGEPSIRPSGRPRAEGQEKEAQGKAEGAQERVERPEAEGVARATPEDYGADNQVITPDRYRELVAQLRQEMATAAEPEGLPRVAEVSGRYGKPSEQQLRALAEIGAFHIEAGTRGFADWSHKVVSDVGDWARDYLVKAYDDAHAQVLKTQRAKDEAYEAAKKAATGQRENQQPELPSGDEGETVGIPAGLTPSETVGYFSKRNRDEATKVFRAIESGAITEHDGARIIEAMRQRISRIGAAQSTPSVEDIANELGIKAVGETTPSKAAAPAEAASKADIHSRIKREYIQRGGRFGVANEVTNPQLWDQAERAVQQQMESGLPPLPGAGKAAEPQTVEKYLARPFDGLPAGTPIKVTGRRVGFAGSETEVVMPNGLVRGLPDDWLRNQPAAAKSEALPSLIKRLGRQQTEELLAEWDSDARLSPDGKTISSFTDPRNQTGRAKISARDFTQWVAERGNGESQPPKPEPAAPKVEAGGKESPSFKHEDAIFRVQDLRYPLPDASTNWRNAVDESGDMKGVSGFIDLHSASDDLLGGKSRDDWGGVYSDAIKESGGEPVLSVYKGEIVGDDIGNGIVSTPVRKTELRVTRDGLWEGWLSALAKEFPEDAEKLSKWPRTPEGWERLSDEYELTDFQKEAFAQLKGSKPAARPSGETVAEPSKGTRRIEPGDTVRHPLFAEGKPLTVRSVSDTHVTVSTPSGAERRIALDSKIGREMAVVKGKSRAAAEKTAEEEPVHEFSSTQVDLPKAIGDKIIAIGRKIPDSELASDGREEHPHVTLKFGLHDQEPDAVRKLLADEGPITVTLGKTSIFPANEASAQRGGEQYDVLKVDVDSPDLRRLNATSAKALAHTDTHPGYQPHVTIAYLKPGEGEKYVGDDSLEGTKATIDSVRFSNKQDEVTKIPLRGGEAEAERGQVSGTQPGPAPAAKRKPELSSQPRRFLVEITDSAAYGEKLNALRQRIREINIADVGEANNAIVRPIQAQIEKLQRDRQAYLEGFANEKGLSSAQHMQATMTRKVNGDILEKGKWPNGKKLTDEDRRRIEGENTELDRLLDTQEQPLEGPSRPSPEEELRAHEAGLTEERQKYYNKALEDLRKGNAHSRDAAANWAKQLGAGRAETMSDLMDAGATYLDALGSTRDLEGKPLPEETGVEVGAIADLPDGTTIKGYEKSGDTWEKDGETISEAKLAEKLRASEVAKAITPRKKEKTFGEETTTERQRPVPGSRRPGEPTVAGAETSVSVPGESYEFKARYTVRELDDIHPSHNAFTFQRNENYWYENDRDYSDPANAQRVIEMTGKFDPRYLVNDNPDATNGPSVIDPDGNVLGGNNRAMSLARIYDENGKAATKYRDLLISKAAQFGLDPDEIKSMNQPVLVREIDKRGLTHPQKAISDLNKAGTAALTQGERAIAEARRLSPESIDYLVGEIDRLGEDASLSTLLEGPKGATIVSKLTKDGVFTKQEQPQLINNKGILTREARDRIGRMLIGRVFRDLDQYDATPQDLRNKLERVIPSLVRTSGNAEWDLSPYVTNAIDAIQEARAHGLRSLDDLRAQQTMFGGGQYSEGDIAVAKTLEGKVKQAIQAFKRYANDEAQSRPGAGGLFGGTTHEDAFKDAFGVWSEPGGQAGTPSVSISSPETGLPAATSPSETPVRTQAETAGSNLSGTTLSPSKTALTTEPSLSTGPSATRFSVGDLNPASKKIILQPFNTREENLAAAEKQRPDLERTLKEVTASVPGTEFMSARVKGGTRLTEKLQGRRPDEVSDYLGARVALDRLGAADEVVAKLKQQGWQVPSDDTFFYNQGTFGYRARHLNIVKGDGISMEIQLVPREVHEFEEGRGHEIYELIRTPETVQNRDTYTALRAESLKGYADAWNRFVERTHPEPVDIKGDVAVFRGGDQSVLDSMFDRVGKESSRSTGGLVYTTLDEGSARNWAAKRGSDHVQAALLNVRNPMDMNTVSAAKLLADIREKHKDLENDPRYEPFLDAYSEANTMTREHELLAKHFWPEYKDWLESNGYDAAVARGGQDIGLWKPETIAAGRYVANYPVEHLKTDPSRFQYKKTEDLAAGTSGTFDESKKWDPEKAKNKPLWVWNDPKDGNTYVVEGHNRFDLAKRSKADTVPVQFIEAKDAAEARDIAALRNIQKGHGTPQDTLRLLEERAARAAKPKAIEPEGVVPGTRKLIDTLKTEVLEKNKSISNVDLQRYADKAFGGTRASGKYTARDMYDAMEAAVNEHLRDRGKELMSDKDPQEALKELRGIVKNLATQTIRTDEQDKFQQFSTPPTLAFVAAKAADVKPGETVLEPSAGLNGLGVFADAAGGKVVTNEISPRRAGMLEMMGYPTTRVDGQFINDLLPQDIKPSVVIMNPPFSATGGRVAANKTKYGLEHVSQALARLEPGGRLVTIMGEGAGMDRAKVQPFWDKLTKKYNVLANYSLSGEEYRKYGTTFDNQLIIVDKTGPTPGADYAERWANVRKGKFSLEDTLDAVTKLPERAEIERPAAAEGAAATASEVRPEGAVAGTAGGVRGGARQSEPTRAGGVEPAGGRGPEPELSAGIYGQRRPGEGDQEVQGGEPEPRPEQAEGAGQPRAGAEVQLRGGADELGGAARLTPKVSLDRNPKSYNRQPTDASGAFVDYEPTYVTGGTPPPSRIVETASMAGVEPPELHYEPDLPRKTLEDKINNVSLETVLYAGQRHEQILPNGQRAGHFTGDGPGVGKGRQLAGIVFDNWNQGRKRALWISARGKTLQTAARRDLDDIGAGHIPLAAINKWAPGADIDAKNGVVFATYSTLVREGKGTGESGVQRRVDQIMKWLGDDGVIIFDEAHKAKNLLSSGPGGQPTKTALAVMELQDKLPMARVEYASATGATDVRNMAYMTRLGLWGDGTPFRDFTAFLARIDGGGLGAMEVASRDMKALGMYNSRTMSFVGPPGSGPEQTVEYRQIEHPVSDEQKGTYDTAAEAWRTVEEKFEEALHATNSGGLRTGFLRGQFRGAQQRFFKQVLTAFKIPTLIKEIEKSRANNESVIISLIGTAEMRTGDLVAKAVGEGRDLNDLDFTPREVISSLVDKYFPTQMYQDVTDPNTGVTTQVPLLDKDGNPVHNQEQLAEKEALLDRLAGMKGLPDNPLDQIINHFGPENIAELSGRSKRLIRDPATGKVVYASRSQSAAKGLGIQEYERRQFQDGKKRIVVISDAAAEGIDLHAARGVKNQDRRNMIVLEFGWSADTTVQKLGRAIRNDQTSAPVITLLYSDVAGEKRFASSIAKRLGSLGALTSGSREAASGASQLAQYNFETKEGAAALRLMYDGMLRGNAVPDIAESPSDVLKKMSLVNERGEMKDDDKVNVTRFLNRVLTLPVDMQNALFDHYFSTFEGVVQAAKEAGTFDTGVTDLKANEVRRAGDPQVVHVDRTTGAKTQYYHLEADIPTQPVSLADVDAMHEADMRAGTREGGTFYRNNKSGKLYFALPSGGQTEAATGTVVRKYSLTSPGRYKGNYVTAEDLADRYTAIDLKDRGARSEWDQGYEAVPPVRTQDVHVISGALLPIWDRVSGVQGAETIRTTTNGGERIVGMRIPAAHVNETLRALGVGVEAKDPAATFRQVLEDGSSFPLEGGLTLKRVKLQGNDRIEVSGADYDHFPVLRQMGLQNERIDWKQRFFVPTEEETGIPLMEKLLERYPIKTDTRVIGVQEPRAEYGTSRSRYTVERWEPAEEDQRDVSPGWGVYDNEKQSFVDVWPSREDARGHARRLNTEGALPTGATGESQRIGIFNKEGKLVGTASLSQKSDPAKWVEENYGKGFDYGPLAMENEPRRLTEGGEVADRRSKYGTGEGQSELFGERPEQPEPAGMRGDEGTVQRVSARTLDKAIREAIHSYEKAPHKAIYENIEDHVLERLDSNETGTIDPAAIKDALDRVAREVSPATGKAFYIPKRMKPPAESRGEYTEAELAKYREGLKRYREQESEWASEVAKRPSPPPVSEGQEETGRGGVAEPRGRYTTDEGGYSTLEILPGTRTALKVAKGLADVRDGLRHVLGIPIGEQAKYTKGMMREFNAEAERRYDQAEAALKKALRYFSRQGMDKNLEALDRFEAGQPQRDPTFQPFFNEMQRRADERSAIIQGLGRGAYQQYVEHYLGRLYKNPPGRPVEFPLVEKQQKEGRGEFYKNPDTGAVIFAEERKEGLQVGSRVDTKINGQPVTLEIKEIKKGHYLLEDSSGRSYKIVKGSQQYRDIENAPGVSYLVSTPGRYRSYNLTAKDLAAKFQQVTPKEARGPWDSPPENASALFATALSKRPMQGPASFLKQRSFEFHKDAREAGYVPLTDNPVEWQLMKLKEMDRFIFAHQTMADLKGEKLVTFVRRGQRPPEGYAQINDPKMVGVFYRDAAGKMTQSGEYYAPKELAEVVNNYLSPGLGGKSWFRGWRTVGNAMSAARLGLSAFHAGKVVYESYANVANEIGTNLGKALFEAGTGTAGRRLGTAAKLTPELLAAPVYDLVRGIRMRRESLRPGSMTPEVSRWLDASIAGGTRTRAEKFFLLTASKRLGQLYREALDTSLSPVERAGKVVSMANPFRLALAGLEKTAWPLMQFTIPRIKLGAMARVAKAELDANPDMSRPRMREVMGEAQDHIDNMFGQMIYDNVFMKRSVKDMAMATLFSVGWTGGTLRDVVGGAKDWGSVAKSIVRGERPEFTRRMASVVTVPAFHALAGAMMMYLLTGKTPKTLYDSIYPPTGEKDKDGKPLRIEPPSYLLDWLGWYQHPGRTLANKLNPAINTIYQMLSNEDYYGQEIFESPEHDEDEPWMKKKIEDIKAYVPQAGKYLGKQTLPFSIRNAMAAYEEMQKDRREKGEGSKAGRLAASWGSAVGLRRAPRGANETALESYMSDIAKSHPSGPKTAAEVEGSKLHRDLLSEMRQHPDGDYPKDLRDRLDALPAREARRLQLDARVTSREARFKMLSPVEAIRAWRVANEEERTELADEMERKLARAERDETIPAAMLNAAAKIRSQTEKYARR